MPGVFWYRDREKNRLLYNKTRARERVWRLFILIGYGEDIKALFVEQCGRAASARVVARHSSRMRSREAVEWVKLRTQGVCLRCVLNGRRRGTREKSRK